MKLFLFLFVFIAPTLCASCVSYNPSTKSELELLSKETKSLTPQHVSTGIETKVQPDQFDPEKDRWLKYKQQGSPEELYCDSPLCEPPHMNINGWTIEGEGKILLPKPYDFDFYEFGVASSQDFILEIKKDGKRQNLVPDVLEFQHLPLARGGKFAFQFRDRSIKLFDVESKLSVAIPKVNCTELLGKFSDQLLLTHSDRNFLIDDEGYETEFCVWDLEGKLLARLQGKLDWVAVSVYALGDEFGIIHSPARTFYVMNKFGAHDGSCTIHLQDLADQKKSSQFSIPKRIPPDDLEDNLACLRWQLEMDGLTVFSESLRYREKNGEWKVAAAVHQ